MKNGNHTQNGNTTFMNHQIKNEEVRKDGQRIVAKGHNQRSKSREKMAHLQIKCYQILRCITERRDKQ